MSESNTPIRVPYGMTVHGEAEIEAVNKVLRSSTQMGHHVRTFEQRVAALFDKQHGIMVNSGSSALLLGVEILELPPGTIKSRLYYARKLLQTRARQQNTES